MNVEGNMRDIVSDKAKGRSGTVNKTIGYARAVIERGFINTNGRLLLIIAASIVLNGELAIETVKFDTKIKTYQFDQ